MKSFLAVLPFLACLLSPPSWWSGLKYHAVRDSHARRRVSTLVVEWIEILTCPSPAVWYCVSTLVVEWIEIDQQTADFINCVVSTLVVEWIEIAIRSAPLASVIVSTLVVEWIEIPG